MRTMLLFSLLVVYATVQAETPISGATGLDAQPVVADTSVSFDLKASSIQYSNGQCLTTITLPLSASTLHHLVIDGEIAFVAPNIGGIIRKAALPSVGLPVCLSGIHDIKAVFGNGVVIEKDLVVDRGSAGVQPQGIKTAALKAALTKLAKAVTSDTVLYYAEKWGSKTIANTIKKYGGKIASKLNELAKWEAVTLDAVQDQIAGMLMGLGVPASTARTVGFVVKTLVNLFL